MTTLEMEIALAQYFGVRMHVIVPNVSWGLGLHECDLIIMSKAGYLTEIEIKISRSDLKKDIEKRHGHHSNKIKYLYFAIPKKLEKDIEFIPNRAGILIVEKRKRDWADNSEYISVSVLRSSEKNKSCRKLLESEQTKLARLGAMRIWGLKEKVLKLKEKLLS